MHTPAEKKTRAVGSVSLCVALVVILTTLVDHSAFAQPHESYKSPAEAQAGKTAFSKYNNSTREERETLPKAVRDEANRYRVRRRARDQYTSPRIAVHEGYESSPHQKQEDRLHFNEYSRATPEQRARLPENVLAAARRYTSIRSYEPKSGRRGVPRRVGTGSAPEVDREEDAPREARQEAQHYAPAPTDAASMARGDAALGLLQLGQHPRVPDRAAQHYAPAPTDDQHYPGTGDHASQYSGPPLMEPPLQQPEPPNPYQAAQRYAAPTYGQRYPGAGGPL